MQLAGSCHCGSVRFRVESHTPYPYMRCYCSICRKTQGGGGYAINIMGDAPTLRVRGAQDVGVVSRAHRGAGRNAQAPVAGAPALLQPLRQRAVGRRSALAGVGVSVRVGDRHAAAEAAGRSRADARLRAASGPTCRRARPHALPRVSARGHRRLARQARADGRVTCGRRAARWTLGGVATAKIAHRDAAAGAVLLLFDRLLRGSGVGRCGAGQRSAAAT